MSEMAAEELRCGQFFPVLHKVCLRPPGQRAALAPTLSRFSEFLGHFNLALSPAEMLGALLAAPEVSGISSLGSALRKVALAVLAEDQLPPEGPCLD